MVDPCIAGTGMITSSDTMNIRSILDSTSAAEEMPSRPMDQISQRYTLIDGRLIPWSGPTQSVETPHFVNGHQVSIGVYPLLDRAHGSLAVEAAARAYDSGMGEWPQMTGEQRIAALEAFLVRMRAQRDVVAELIMAETAKPRDLSFKEFDRTVEYINKTISAYRELTCQEGIDRVYGGNLQAHVERTPLGVTLCMSPFNYPLNETFTSLIPALIMGNTAVVKPAKIGVLLFEPLLQAFKECFPPGVVNFVYGDGHEVISPIMESGLVDTLAFIGSTRVANIVSGLHPAPNRLNKVLGLGAHNPAIILEDADLQDTIKEIIAGSLTFNGQRCTTLALHFVDARRGSEYAELVSKEVQALKVGSPEVSGVQITALAEGPEKLNYLKELIRDACDKGARIVNPHGGEIVEGAMVPAVLYPVDESMRIFKEEQFGPIVPIVPFDDEERVISAITGSNYGQQLAIFSQDMATVDRWAKKLKNSFGRINVNSQCQRGPDDLPFTGKKDSALGTLSVVDALKAFSSPTVMSVRG